MINLLAMSGSFHALIAVRSLIICFAITLISACSFRGTPPVYQPSADIINRIDLTAIDLANLQAATSEQERNRLQNKAIAVINLNFNQFERDLVADRADTSAAVAGTTLASSIAGVLVGSASAKENFALLNAGVIGAFGIIDKNYFYDKTVPALVSAMGAARASVLLHIKTSQRDTVEIYDGTAALDDINAYFTAGTVFGAISAITTKAENDKQTALDKVRALEVPTNDEITRRKAIRDSIWAIDDQAMGKANIALSALGLSTQKTPVDTRASLLDVLRNGTPERINSLEKALKGSGLLK